MDVPFLQWSLAASVEIQLSSTCSRPGHRCIQSADVGDDDCRPGVECGVQRDIPLRWLPRIETVDDFRRATNTADSQPIGGRNDAARPHRHAVPGEAYCKVNRLRHEAADREA